MKTLSYSIVFSGKISSGKTAIAKRISQSMNIPRISFGEYLVQYAIDNGLQTTRESLQTVGENLVRKDPKSFLNDVISFYKSPSNALIFDGVRHSSILHQIQEMSSRCDIIFIDVDDNVRYQRYLGRNKEIDQGKSKDSLIKFEQHEVEQEIENIRLVSTILIDGSKALEDVVKEVIGFLNSTERN